MTPEEKAAHDKLAADLKAATERADKAEADLKTANERADKAEAAAGVVQGHNAELTAELARVRKVVTAPAPPPEDPNVVRVAGIPGGKLKVHGTNLGTEKGTVRLNGVDVEVTDWSPTVISGRIPHDVVDGEVVVTSKDGKARKGKFIR